MSPAQLAEMFYRAGIAPWDIGESQPIIRQLVALGAIRGDVLDPGCGTGWNAIEYARAGCTVTGIDASRTAIQRARRNRTETGATVDFQIGDATRLQGEARFDTVVDSKLYDNLEPADRPRYTAVLHRILKPGGRLYMFGFGPGLVNGVHNHLLGEPDYEQLLPAAGFTITYIGETTYQVVNALTGPICPDCPTVVSGERIHIPMTEIHATRPHTQPKGAR